MGSTLQALTFIPSLWVSRLSRVSRRSGNAQKRGEKERKKEEEEEKANNEKKKKKKKKKLPKDLV